MQIPTVEIPKDPAKLKKQIAAMEWQIEHDTNKKDREIHIQALEQLREAEKTYLEGKEVI